MLDDGAGMRVVMVHCAHLRCGVVDGDDSLRVVMVMVMVCWSLSFGGSDDGHFRMREVTVC